MPCRKGGTARTFEKTLLGEQPKRHSPKAPADEARTQKQQAFDDATIKALREWRFKPLVLEGRAIEVVHELTVFYQLVYR